MLTLTLIDSISLPGRANRPNEDTCGFAHGAAFVIDGATGLGENYIVGDTDSDAAWLAAFCKVHFEEMLLPGRPVSEVVRATNRLAKRIADFAAGRREIPAWANPVAGFQMLRAEGDRLFTYGLGDCVLLLQAADGSVSRHSALPDLAGKEKDKAREVLASAGGLGVSGSVVGEPSFRDRERSFRAAYNTQGGALWTLGIVEAAGDHVASIMLEPGLPARGLLMSDGFAALSENYERYDYPDLMAAVSERGLVALGRELRAIERDEDPHGDLYPRFKVSDDATAMLVEIRRIDG
ncbi:MAG TPA: hypothetical protein PKE65_05190 [Rhizobiaceae bacterium]|nr:hypothetical protein [Rhizobiaceae bacterium]